MGVEEIPDSRHGVHAGGAEILDERGEGLLESPPGLSKVAVLLNALEDVRFAFEDFLLHGRGELRPHASGLSPPGLRRSYGVRGGRRDFPRIVSGFFRSGFVSHHVSRTSPSTRSANSDNAASSIPSVARIISIAVVLGDSAKKSFAKITHSSIEVEVISFFFIQSRHEFPLRLS